MSTRKDASRASRAGHMGDARTSKIRMSMSSMTSSRSSRASRSSRLGASRRTFGQSETTNAPAVIVKNEKGEDVTPVSLLNIKPTVLKNNGGSMSQSTLQSGQASPQSEVSEAQASSFGKSGFSSGSETPSIDDETRSDLKLEHEQGSADEPAESRPKVLPEEDVPIPLESDLENTVRLKFVETDTIWLLDIPGSRIGSEYADLESVKTQNQIYESKLKARIGNDKYVERSMQTLNAARKMKECQATPVQTSDIGCTASNWDIADSLAALEQDDPSAWNPDDVIQQRKKEQQAAEATIASMVNQTIGGEEASDSVLSPGDQTMTGDGGEGDQSQANTQHQQQKVPLMQSVSFMKTCQYMERMVTQNVYHGRQLIYRNMEAKAGIVAAVEDEEEPEAETPDIPSIDVTQTQEAEEAPPPTEIGEDGLPILKPEPLPSGKQLKSGLTKLWTFTCGLSKGRNVSAMCLNKLKPDILAVAYGQFEFGKQLGGLVLIWSLKNPEFPERVYRAKCGVTSLDFSTKSPNLLAVGLYDGTVAIYDLKKYDAVPSLESSHTSGKHSDAVWEVRWVDRGAEKGEMLVSISTDGRVTQWSIKKGLEHTDLMKLKRVSGQGKSGPTGKGDAFISRMASGLCFDFMPKDTNIYLAATEDGNIHKCSCSYNEQYLDNFFGHTGPVYKVRWSPYHPDVFLSASADWTVKAWHSDNLTPLLSFQSCTDYVADVVWSPHTSTIFGSVTGDGRIDIWDLAVSPLDPIVTEKVTDKKPSAILFAQNSPVVIVGDDSGGIDVYRIGGIDTNKYTKEEQLSRLEKSLASKDATVEEQAAASAH